MASPHRTLRLLVGDRTDMTSTSGIPGVSKTARRELRRSFSLRVLTAVGGLLSTFVTLGLVSRYLSAEDAAVYLGVLAALMLGPMLGRFGLGQNVLRTIGQESDLGRRRHVAGTHLRIALFLTALTAPFVAVITTIRLAGDGGRFVVVAALTASLVILETVRLMASDVFAATSRVVASVATTHHVRSILALPLVAALVRLVDQPTLTDVLLVYLAAGAFPLLAVGLAAIREISLWTRPANGAVTSALRAGFALFTVDAGLFLVGRGDVWLANAVFSDIEAQRYSTASTVAFQAMVLQGLASLAITPIAARMWASGERADLLRLLRAVATLTTASTVAAIVALAVVGRPLLDLLGKGLAQGYPLLVVLAVGGLGQAVFGMNITLLIAQGRLRRAAGAAGAALLAVVPVAVVAALAWGPLGLAVATAFAMIAYSGGLWLAVRPLVAGIGQRAALPGWNLVQALRDARDPSAEPSG